MLLDGRRRLWTERERTVALWLHRGADSPAVLATLLLVSRLGDGVLWYVMVATLPFWGGPEGWKCALYMVALGVVNFVFYSALKQRVARPRPSVSCPGIRACCRALDEFSFPSGHTTHAVAFALLLGHYYPALAWPLWGFAVLIALSRVVLGLHFPSDVAVGATIGAVTAGFMLVVV
ncbi:phosphatase PAP2 family protein [Piscinibacter sp. XHJ-5]|uniref:phosphatase PAP2 family protein n=1 Tax=Piscinibacter sp. XHJ-5 TaxID=3037797 RepID=UPI002452A83D|nr:phosphatase PAP2 family protein [Piscinibacter sp. XHJ-5]